MTHFAIQTLQNYQIIHFVAKKFAHVKKKLYLCSVIKKKQV